MLSVCPEYENCLFERAMFKDLLTFKGFRNTLIRILIALILGGLLLGALVHQQQQNMKQNAQKPEGVTITIDLSSQIGISQFMTGVTRTQLDDGPMTPAGRQLMGQALSIQN